MNVLEDEVKAVRLYEYGSPENLKFADDIRDGKFLLPVSRRLPLRDASEVQRGGAGKIVLVCRDM
jgi:hypothetical protein